ncbi:MAG: permease [Caldisericia bacterium]|nr:permease [Caldisericia bacterium]
MKKGFAKRYLFALLSLIALGILFLIRPSIGMKAMNISLATTIEMLLIIPPVFILLGLLDVWVPKSVMMKFMGPQTGMKGHLFALILGSATAGPLYGAFPVAAVLSRKGVSFVNIMIFIGAWSTTKIPMLLFEIESLGLRFALTRLCIDIPGIILIAFILQKMLQNTEIESLQSTLDTIDQ